MTPDIQKEIKEALEELKDSPNRTSRIRRAYKHIKVNAPPWLQYQQELIEKKDAEIEKLREIQQAIVVLTPMQRMSKAMDIIAKQKGAST